MPRPKKCRRVCSLPLEREFSPPGYKGGREAVVLSVDEYESIRLIDKEGLSQEECAKFMSIARTTAQQIYNSARKKLATALVNGCAFRIEGGEFVLCGGEHKGCNHDFCVKRRLQNREGRENNEDSNTG